MDGVAAVPGDVVPVPVPATQPTKGRTRRAAVRRGVRSAHRTGQADGFDEVRGVSAHGERYRLPDAGVFGRRRPGRHSVSRCTIGSPRRTACWSRVRAGDAMTLCPRTLRGRAHRVRPRDPTPLFPPPGHRRRLGGSSSLPPTARGRRRTPRDPEGTRSPPSPAGRRRRVQLKGEFGLLAGPLVDFFRRQRCDLQDRGRSISSCPVGLPRSSASAVASSTSSRIWKATPTRSAYSPNKSTAWESAPPAIAPARRPLGTARRSSDGRGSMFSASVVGRAASSVASPSRVRPAPRRRSASREGRQKSANASPRVRRCDDRRAVAVLSPRRRRAAAHLDRSIMSSITSDAL